MIDLLPDNIQWDKARKVTSFITLLIIVLSGASVIIAVIASFVSKDSVSNSYLPLMLVIWAIFTTLAIGLVNGVVWAAYMLNNMRSGKRKVTAKDKLTLIFVSAIILFYLVTFIINKAS